MKVSSEIFWRSENAKRKIEDDMARKASRIQRYRISKRPDSPRMVKLMKKWIAHCEDAHPVCGVNMQSSFIPTRLVNVDTGDEAFCRLVETTDENAITDYVALSYCWGKEKFLNTTMGTLEKRKERIKFERCGNTAFQPVR